jgi:hypothetical protein
LLILLELKTEDVDEALENPKDLAATAFLFVAEEEATARVVADF